MWLMNLQSDHCMYVWPKEEADVLVFHRGILWGGVVSIAQYGNENVYFQLSQSHHSPGVYGGW